MRNNSVKMRNNVNLFWYYSEYYSETVWFMSGKYRMISELKSNDCLKMDGQNYAVLLLGLRNEYNLHRSSSLDITSSWGMFKWRILLHILPAKRRCLHHPVLNAACLSARSVLPAQNKSDKIIFSKSNILPLKNKKTDIFPVLWDICAFFSQTCLTIRPWSDILYIFLERV